MQLDEKCSEVMKGRGWTQRRLAEELGITEANLSSARKGKRPLPTAAVIRLERLRGVDDHSIIEQILKTAACVSMAAVTIFLTTAPEARAAQGIAPRHAQQCTLSRFRNNASRYLSRIFRSFRSRINAVALSG